MTREGYGVAIRADASASIGAGHVMRCLALAWMLRQRGERVAFVCRDLPGNLLDVIRGAEFAALVLPDAAGAPSPAEDAAATLALLGPRPRRVVVDHYELDVAWERAARAAGVRCLVAVDDLARPHDCDVLVDVNLSAEAMGHERLVPPGCELLLGPAFALLHPGFLAVRARTAARREGHVHRVLVSFGGGDVGGPTRAVIEALGDPRFASLEVEVVVPESTPDREGLAAALAALPNARLLGRVDDMPFRMGEADFMCGAAGGQGLERCCVGLPSAVVTVAANQEAPAALLAATGACRLLGRAADVDAAAWREALVAALENPEANRWMSAAGMEVVDGFGTLRVANAMLAGAPVGPRRDRVRPMDERDLTNVWRWRNREEVRRVMFSTGEIAWEDHLRWFRGPARSSGLRALVYESAGTPLGFVKFERFDSTRESCEWGFYVGPPDAPRGTGSRMGWLALTYAFDDLGVSRVKGVVTATNERSLRYHDRLGFARTGDSTRESTGGTVPVVEYELAAGHWREIAPALKAQFFGE